MYVPVMLLMLVFGGGASVAVRCDFGIDVGVNNVVGVGIIANQHQRQHLPK